MRINVIVILKDSQNNYSLHIQKTHRLILREIIRSYAFIKLLIVNWLVYKQILIFLQELISVQSLNAIFSVAYTLEHFKYLNYNVI